MAGTASIIFTYLFTRLKPNLKISTDIAYSNGSYKIKIINKSYFSAIHIKARLSYIKHFDVPGGHQETQATPIPLTLPDGELFSIDKFDSNIQFATYSYRFRTIEDIRNGLTLHNRLYIRIKIPATHSLSNIGKVFTQNYYEHNIINGDFQFGDNITVV